VHEEPELDLEYGALEPGDVFVVCSDGLTAHVEDPEILAGVAKTPCQEACDALVSLTLERGAADNVTVIVVRYRPDRQLSGGLHGRRPGASEALS